MTLLEMLKVVNEGCNVTVYTETEEIYSGNFPHWADIPTEYMKSKVVLVTGHELEISIHVEEA